MTDKYFIDRDKLKQEIQWVEDIIEKGGCCFICFYNDDPLVLELFELHHIGKRNNTNVTITVCPICHAKLTRKQKSWDGECNNL